MEVLRRKRERLTCLLTAGGGAQRSPLEDRCGSGLVAGDGCSPDGRPPCCRTPGLDQSGHAVSPVKGANSPQAQGGSGRAGNTPPLLALLTQHPTQRQVSRKDKPGLAARRRRRPSALMHVPRVLRIAMTMHSNQVMSRCSATEDVQDDCTGSETPLRCTDCQQGSGSRHA